MTDLEYHNRELHSEYIGGKMDGELLLRCTRCSYETTNIDEVHVRVVTFLLPSSDDSSSNAILVNQYEMPTLY